MTSEIFAVGAAIAEYGLMVPSTRLVIAKIKTLEIGEFFILPPLLVPKSNRIFMQESSYA